MEIKNVTFSYDRKINRLHGIEAEVETGRITTIIGPNGCGKSTLLGVMSRHHAPSSGEIVLDGKTISTYTPKEFARKLAVVHQHNQAPSDLTVEKLVQYGRMPHRKWLSGDREEDERAVERALAGTNLLEKRQQRIDGLSGGERQRVWIAMALAQDTPILFLDEPTTYLDIYYQLEILELVKRLNEEFAITIVMVLHDINQAIRYSDRIIVMKDGRIHKTGKPQEIITEQLMQEVYGVQVSIRHEDDIGMHIIPTGISQGMIEHG